MDAHPPNGNTARQHTTNIRPIITTISWHYLLGRPRSIKKSDIECHFLKFLVEIAKWPCGSSSMTPNSNTNRESAKMHIWCKFGDSSWNSLQIMRGQVKFLIILSQTKWLWRLRSVAPIFNTSREYLRMQVLCKCGDFSPILWRVIARTSRISWNSESKLTKWSWRSRSMTRIFNTSRDYSCGQGQVCVRTDGRTDGRLPATSMPRRPERPRGKKQLFVHPKLNAPF